MDFVKGKGIRAYSNPKFTIKNFRNTNSENNYIYLLYSKDFNSDFSFAFG